MVWLVTSSILSGVPMVVGVKTVKVLRSKVVGNPDYQGEKCKNHSCCQKRKLSEKLLKL